LSIGPLLVSAFVTPPVVFGLLLVVQRSFARIRRVRERKQAKTEGVSRRDFIGQGAAGLIIVSGAALGGYTTFVEPWRLRVARYDIPIEGLPPELDGFTLVHLSDTHHGPYITLPYIEHAIARANALKADLAVLTGDYVHRTPRSIVPGIHVFRQLKTRLGTVAVMGNHEYWEGIDACRAAFAETPVRLVENTRVFVTRDGLHETPAPRALCLGGVGDMWEDEVRFDRSTADAPEDMPRILLSHNPDTAERLSPRFRVDLMFSGHTHGGQVSLPRVGTPMVPSRYGSKYAGGLCSGPYCRVLVSRGVGMAILPVRFRVRPEIGVITLRCGG
jgi:predicted MPP superfamily phosphohydrolase